MTTSSAFLALGSNLGDREQNLARGGLERPQALADGRGRDVQGDGGGVEGALLDDRAQRAELLEVELHL